MGEGGKRHVRHQKEINEDCTTSITVKRVVYEGSHDEESDTIDCLQVLSDLSLNHNSLNNIYIHNLNNNLSTDKNYLYHLISPQLVNTPNESYINSSDSDSTLNSLSS